MATSTPAFTRGELLVDPATHTARAYVTLETGERYRFGPTTIEQSALRAGLVAPLPSLPGRRLVRRGVAAAHPVRARRFAVLLDRRGIARGARSQEQGRGGSHHVRAEPAPCLHDCAPATARTRARAEQLGWEDRRLNTRGHRLRAELRASDIDNSADINYIVPWTDPALEKLSYQPAHFPRAERADVETDRHEPSRSDSRRCAAKWQRVISVTLDQTEDTVTTRLGRLDARRSQPDGAARPRHHFCAPAPGFPRRQHRAARLPGRAARLDRRARLRHEFHARGRARRASLQAGGQVAPLPAGRNRRERGRRVRGPARAATASSRAATTACAAMATKSSRRSTRTATRSAAVTS